MKISKKFSKKLKKTFDIYNIAIIGCVFLIVLSVYIIVKPDKKTSENGIEIIQTDIKKSEEISEKEAKKVAQKQFKKLGEKVKLEDLECRKIRRNQEEYYYITSADNSLEITVIGGKIERINSVLVAK